MYEVINGAIFGNISNFNAYFDYWGVDLALGLFKNQDFEISQFLEIGKIKFWSRKDNKIVI